MTRYSFIIQICRNRVEQQQPESASSKDMGISCVRLSFSMPFFDDCDLKTEHRTAVVLRLSNLPSDSYPTIFTYTFPHGFQTPLEHQRRKWRMFTTMFCMLWKNVVTLFKKCCECCEQCCKQCCENWLWPFVCIFVTWFFAQNHRWMFVKMFWMLQNVVKMLWMLQCCEKCCCVVKKLQCCEKCCECCNIVKSSFPVMMAHGFVCGGLSWWQPNHLELEQNLGDQSLVCWSKTVRMVNEWMQSPSNSSEIEIATDCTPCKSSLSVGVMQNSTAHWLLHGVAGMWIPLCPFMCVKSCAESSSWLSSSSGTVKPRPTSLSSGFAVPGRTSAAVPFHSNNGSTKIFKLNHVNGFIKMLAGFSIPECAQNATSHQQHTPWQRQTISMLSKHQVRNRTPHDDRLIVTKHPRWTIKGKTKRTECATKVNHILSSPLGHHELGTVGCSFDLTLLFTKPMCASGYETSECHWWISPQPCHASS